MNTFSIRSCFVVAAVAGFVLAGCATQPLPKASGSSPEPAVAEAPVTEPATEVSARSLSSGGNLSLHRRVVKPLAAGAANRVVLLLHPLDIPGAEAFNVAGYSLMDYLAEQRFDVWATDYRGFGRSSAAPEVFDGKRQRVPTPRLEDTLGDVREAVDTILLSTGATSLSLIGYGYGGLVAGAASEQMPDKVSRLVLYGTAFAFKIGKAGAQLAKQPLESKPGVLNPKIADEQAIYWEGSTLAAWQKMMAGKPLAEPQAIEAVAAAFRATDYLDATNVRPTVRRPTAPLLDMYRVWSNKPLFNAARIKVPTLIIRGELDFYADPDLARQLTGTKIVREIIIKDATHWMLYEKSHEQVFAETSRFLGGH
jgi:pimeloyl-ACP methyl ester carboxylesterase